MKNFIFLAIFAFILLLPFEAEAVKDDEISFARDYALKHTPDGQVSKSVFDEDVVMITPIKTNAKCRTFVQTVEEKQRDGSYVLIEDASYEACYYGGYGWLVPGTREYSNYLRDMDRAARQAERNSKAFAQNSCRTTERTTQRANSQREFERAARSGDWERFGASLISGVIFKDRRTTTSCRW